LAKLFLSKQENIDLNADVPILQVVISKKRKRHVFIQNVLIQSVHFIVKTEHGYRQRCSVSQQEETDATFYRVTFPLAQAVMILACILEVPGSNLRRDIRYDDSDLS
jgi:hypothetical protein